MVKGRELIIEGTSDTRNGFLRQGFHKLLIQKLKGKMPRIVMGDGKNQAIATFLNSRNDRISNLLIDLDGKESIKGTALEENSLTEKSSSVYFMVQEMEAWFLSQPEILDTYYGVEISKKIPNKHACEIQNPSAFLNKIVYSQKRKKYHKVVHAVELLQLLDANKLMDEFGDFKELIDTLKT